MPKSGTPYQNAVAEVVKALEPNAHIQEGEWIEGPDGERECDITVRGQINGRDVLVLIECKDWGRSIPIGVVDALHSKAPDVGADVAIICSNTNFSSAALDKAARVGIIALSALKEGDLRVRTNISQTAALQDFQFSELSATAITLAGKYLDLTQVSVRRNGRSLNEWLAQNLTNEVAKHPQENDLIFNYDMKPDLLWDVAGLGMNLSKVHMNALYQRRWLQGKIEIQAERSLYDHVTTRLAVATGTQFSIVINNVKWKPISVPNPDDGLTEGVERLILSRVGIPELLLPKDCTSFADTQIEEIVSTHRVVVGPRKPFVPSVKETRRQRRKK